MIEIKKIYEARLFTILTPNIYEGFKSLYTIGDKLHSKFVEESKRNPNVEAPSVLVLFQKMISNIPNLNAHKVRNETDRIKTASRSADIFDDLVKAVIKSNIILMTYNVDYKRKDLIQTRYHESIIVHDFVHSCYIESARIFHNRPELFWTGYSPEVINQNKRISYEVIENAIRESINLALPMKEILSEYLNNPYEMKDDIRIYVIGDPKPDTRLDLENQNVMRYPGEFGGNGDLIRRGGALREGDEEFMNAHDLIDRDLGVYIGHNNQVDSLLESESDKTRFEPGGRSNLSVLLGSESEATRASKESADSLLEESEIPHITPAESNQDGGTAEHTNSVSNVSHASEASNASNASVASNAVVDGVRMVGLKASLNGRGQAKSFFNEILPEANKKAEKYRQKVREKGSSGDDTPEEKRPDKESDKKSDHNSDSDRSDQSGIRITRTTDVPPSVKDPKEKKTEHQSVEVTTDNVEALLDDILSGKTK